MDSRSTPGNPYISEGEGLDIFQKVPYNMPIIRRSNKFPIGLGWYKASIQTCEIFRCEIEKEGTYSYKY